MKVSQSCAVLQYREVSPQEACRGEDKLPMEDVMDVFITGERHHQALLCTTPEWWVFLLRTEQTNVPGFFGTVSQ